MTFEIIMLANIATITKPPIISASITKLPPVLGSNAADPLTPAIVPVAADQTLPLPNPWLVIIISIFLLVTKTNDNSTLMPTCQ